MVIYLYEQLGSTSLCQKIQRKPLLVWFFNHLICCHQPFCTAEPNERELFVLMIQKKHIYKLIVSPVYSSNRTVNNLTGKKSKFRSKVRYWKKSKAYVYFSVKGLPSQNCCVQKWREIQREWINAEFMQETYQTLHGM